MLAPAEILTATIADEGSVSSAVFVGSGEPVLLIVPSVISAALTFQVSESEAGTYRNVYNSDGTTETSVGASTGDRCVAAPAAIKGAQWLKVRSGTAGTPVAQTSGPIAIGIVVK